MMGSKFLAVVLFAIISLNTVTESSKVESFEIVTMIKNRFAETTISSEVLNDNSNEDEEVGFHVMLPKDAFITYFAMTINGTVYEGEIEEKQKAEKKYQEAKKQGRTAGIVKTVEESNKVFKTGVNVAAGVAVNFTLIYQQLLNKVNGRYKNTIIILGSSLGSSVTPKVEVFICESRTIRDVRTLEADAKDANSYKYETAINSIGSSAHVKFLNIEIPKTSSGIEGSFIVEYELEDINAPGEIIFNNGYMVHFFAPPLEISQRRVVFVLDISGSMSGTKLRQQTQAMLKILDKFTENDRIGLVKFTDSYVLWKSGELLTGTKKNIELAKSFIKFNHRSGGTYIWQALSQALDMLHADAGEEQVIPETNFIVLLTDGQGSISKDAMVQNVEKANGKRFAINTVGFGRGVDADMLKAVAANNHGSWKQILEGFDAQLQIESYVDELGLSFIDGIQIEYPDIFEEIVQPSNRYYAGTEFISIAKLKNDVDLLDSDSHLAVIKGHGKEDFYFEEEFDLQQDEIECKTFDREDIVDFGKKAFGMVMLDKVLRAHDGELNKTIKAELKEKAINVSMEYSLVSSVTSMLVIKPDDEKSIEKALEVSTTQATTTTFAPVAVAYDALIIKPMKHRASKGFSGYGDPHFVMRLSDDVNICFNWHLQGEKVINLVNDVENSFVVNALFTPDSKYKTGDGSEKHGLYMRVANIILQRDQIQILVDEDKAVITDLSIVGNDGGIHLPLNKGLSYNYTFKNVYFEVTQKPSIYKSLLKLTINGNINIVIDTHRHNPKAQRSRAHIDVTLTDTEGLSNSIDGFYGSFHIPKEMQKSQVRIIDNEKKHRAKFPHLIVFKNKRMMVRRKEKKLPHTDGTFDCWWVNEVEYLIGHPLEDFVEETMFSVPK